MAVRNYPSKGVSEKAKYPRNEPKGRQMSCHPKRHALGLIPASSSDKEAELNTCSFPLLAYIRWHYSLV